MGKTDGVLALLPNPRRVVSWTGKTDGVLALPPNPDPLASHAVRRPEPTGLYQPDLTNSVQVPGLALCGNWLFPFSIA